MINGVYNIKSLFALADVQQLVIPEVQRDYVWEEKNCNRLYHTIKHAFDNRKNNMPDSYSQITDMNLRNDFENRFIEKNCRVNLGFIYAYHDSDYIGKQFVIDGQQRFTSIFLLLFACYKSSNRIIEFKNSYFKKNIPKLDYKVREASHDFLIALIIDQCNGNSYKGIEQRLWWRPDYDNDLTVKNIKNNYVFFLKQITEISPDEQSSFLDYLERNVDFKFFDVPISEQGEQLYLFMNSRGVKLNFQEKIRAEIISKHGLECGIFWENAQQYFWKKRNLNKDAEFGFNEFLKWIVIINIAEKNKDYSKYSDFIIRPTTEKQIELLESYLIDNIEDFNIKYLEGVFNATIYFFDVNNTDSIISDQNWLTSPDEVVMPMRTYLKFIPIIYYIYRQQISNALDEQELRRVSAFIILCNQSRTYQKNPQLWLLNFIRFIMDLCDDKSLKSIMKFDVTSNRFIGRDFSKKYFEIYHSISNEERFLLEDFVIQMIIDAERDSGLEFLHGDYRIILQSLPTGEHLSSNIIKMKSYCEKLKWFIGLDFNTQRKLLLTYGDYSYPLSETKYDYGQDKVSWGDIFTNQAKIEIFKNFLNDQISLDNFGIENKISSWQKQNPISHLVDDERYLHYLVKYNFNKNYLAWGWGNNDHIIRIHTVRKSGYNYSIDIFNWVVVNSLKEKIEKLSIEKSVKEGWVDGSHDKSFIRFSLNNQLCLSVAFVPNDWNSGSWVLVNSLDPSNPEYNRFNEIINNIPQTNTTTNEDVVDVGIKVIEFILNHF